MLAQSQGSSQPSPKGPLTTQDLETTHIPSTTAQLEIELSDLQSKILEIESRLFKYEPNTATHIKPSASSSTKQFSFLISPRSKLRVTKPKSMQISPISSPRPSVNIPRPSLRMKKVKKSEKEIAKIQGSEIQLSSKEHSIYSQIQSIRHELQYERKRGETLSKENSSIKKQLNKTQSLVASLARLEEQYNTLVLKYERSEQIRGKQNKMIDLLKSELYVRLGICKDM
jgi:hypothetical protein